MTDTLLRVEVCGGIWDVTPRSLWQQVHLSVLWHSAGSAARRAHFPDPSRRDHTTHANLIFCHCLQPSSAAVSAVAIVGTISTDDRGYPHTAIVLTSKIEKRQTFTVRGSIHGNASVPRSFGFTTAWPDGDFFGNLVETDRFANGWTAPI